MRHAKDGCGSKTMSWHLKSRCLRTHAGMGLFQKNIKFLAAPICRAGFNTCRWNDFPKDLADRDIRLNFVELCMFARFAHKMHVFLRV